MPLRDGAYPSAVISPWLANLLPEEEQLSILTRSLGVDRADTLALLAEIGGDTAGALSFGETASRADWRHTPLTEFYAVDDPMAALDRHFDDLGRRPFLAGEEGVRASLAGGQKKTALSVLSPEGEPVLRLPQKGDILAVPRNGAPSTIIIKPDNPENETYCLKLAHAIGIGAAEATILTTHRRRAICVLRYDRRTSRKTGVLQRVHQEDFAQANGAPPRRKYECGAERGPDLKTLLNTGRALSAPDALALLDQGIFNILVANTDAHAKNYSILFPVAAGPQLAPLYGVSTVLAWPSVVQYYAQNLAGKRRKPGDMAKSHWDAIAQEVSYRPTDVRRRVQELVDAMVAARVAVTTEMTEIPGSAAGYGEETASLIEANALRIAGRL